MSIFPRGKTQWYKFNFAGQVIRESAKSGSKTVARAAERTRRQELEQAYNGLNKSNRAQLFSVAAETWINSRNDLSPRSVIIEKLNLKHLKKFLGSRLLCDITPAEISSYQAARQNEAAAPKTINLEVGTLRAILKRNRLWANIQPDVKMLRVRDDVGRALSDMEETALLEQCQRSRSRSLYVVVELALGTCMRYSEMRLMRWNQIDFSRGELRVGHSKTEHGEGRVIPMNQRVRTVLEFWAASFPSRKPNHYVSPLSVTVAKVARITSAFQE